MTMGPYQRHMGSLRAQTLRPSTAVPDSDRFDVLTTPVAGLQALLDSGHLTSVELVDEYLAQIKRHNTEGMAVRALISIAPRVSLLTQASCLDMERRLKGKRGPMHGIPVIVKVPRHFRSEKRVCVAHLDRTHFGLTRPCKWTRHVGLLHCEVHTLQGTLPL
jgi:hypothetical protein